MTRKRTYKPKAKTVSAKDSFCVYIGPTIMGVIQNGTIYRGNKETVVALLSEEISKRPLLASLIVTSETLAEDRIKVKTPGNLLHVNYRKLASGK